MLALGCQKVTREALRAGLAAGIELVDTALAYGNEAMIGETHAPYIVTKGGLGPDWIPDGRARTLAASARASRERLGRIDLYLLHAIDPKVPLATSVRALAKLRDEGVVGAIGVANLTLAQLEEALAITAIDAIEIPLGIHQLANLHLVEACERRGIRVLAYRPFGGATGVKKVLKDPLLRELGAPCEVALAFLRGLSPVVVPLPGATRIETAVSCARARELPAEAMAALRARFLGGDHAPARDGEVVLIMGIPGAGKSTLAARFPGYTRLNRDERGGTLNQLADELAATLERGDTRVVLDNTYATRSSRAQVVRIAQRRGVAVRCVALATSLEDAQRNAAARILERYGRLLEPAELVAEHQIGPGAQFRYRRQLEPPRLEEGFAALEQVAFERAPEPDGAAAAIFELDGLIWEGRPRAQPAL
ncbi:MAG: aldo/keto reductase, partial [Kofleriaceae bacterium]